MLSGFSWWFMFTSSIFTSIWFLLSTILGSVGTAETVRLRITMDDHMFKNP